MFANDILAFYDTHRRDLPWRQTRDPYAIWISEIMCQQTRVATVIPYFERWLASFPTVASLAAADTDDVLAHWSGLGYYSRARNLHRGAKELVASNLGSLPQTAHELMAVPGIGRYTAGAIASIAFDEPAALVDGNVARVLARVFAIEDDIKSTAGQKRLWQQAEELIPLRRPGDYNQGLMELGATLCAPRRPRCSECPVQGSCEAYAANRQEELPVRPPRKKAVDKLLLDRAALWNRTRSGILLAHRTSSGLYGGLWELPQVDIAQEISDLVGCDVEIADTPTLVHQQELSHRRLRISVLEGELLRGRYKRPPQRFGYHKLRRVRLRKLGELGISSATQHIIARYQP